MMIVSWKKKNEDQDEQGSSLKETNFSYSTSKKTLVEDVTVFLRTKEVEQQIYIAILFQNLVMGHHRFQKKDEYGVFLHRRLSVVRPRFGD